VNKILITSALPYANGPLHFGHIAGAYLPGDTYARFERLHKKDVLFICGSDEYGIAITLAADLAKKTPKEHVDQYHAYNKWLFEKMEMSFDYYGRTTGEEHLPIVQQFFLDLLKNGYIHEKIENHLFSEEENKFLSDRYVLGTCPVCAFDKARGDECPKCGASFEATQLKNPVSKISGKKLVLKPSKHWYLRFDLFKEKLSAWIKDKNWKPNVLEFAKNYINDLHERAISRDLSWGVPLPLPHTEGKVLYVWFDAPIGYISITKEWAKKQHAPNKWQDYWLDPQTKLVNFIGKDNIPFHTVFFPAMVMGQNQPFKLVDDVPANEFFLLEGRQFSKSDKWYIDLEDFFSRYSVDQIRYYLAANAPENADSEFTWKEFGLRCNSELVGKLGNFINRTLVFTHKNLKGEIPPLHKLQMQDELFQKEIELKMKEIEEAYQNYSLRKASQILMEMSALANGYFDAKKPWVLAKDPSLVEDLQTTIHLCLWAIKMLALASNPIMPVSSEKIWQMLGFDSKLIENSWHDIVIKKMHPGKKLNQPELLFNKIEEEQIEKEIQKLKANH
jgi:methionyl-tRNA synthetase